MRVEESRARSSGWPLVAAVAAYISVSAVQLYQIIRLTGGRQLYPLDDVYIHAAVAKNLLLHHVYGVSPLHSSFPSSSIVWPFILLAVFATVGIKAFVPLALNVVFALVFLALADHVLRALAETISPYARFLCLLLLVLGVPLVGLSFEGMEHVLHGLAILALLFAYNREQIYRNTRWRFLLTVAASFAVAVRYESLFAVLLICLLLAWRGEWAIGLMVAISSLVPVVAFGLFAHAHGSAFLPSSVLLKTSSAEQLSILTGIRKLFSTYALLSGISVCFLTSVVLTVYLFVRPPKGQRPLRDLLLILTGMFVIHAQVAQFGWLFRYEAYLLATSIVLAFAATEVLTSQSRPAPSPFRWHSPRAVTMILLTVALAGRGESMLIGIPRNAAAIYEQQYQTARFLAAFYPHQAIGLNDIGAPDFFADIECVDLLGLASNNVAQLRRSGGFNREAVARVSREQGIRVAVLYPELFPDEIPYSWIPVSNMVVTNLPGKVQLGQRRVTLYAPNLQEAARLLHNITQFQGQLPPGVEVTGASGLAANSAAKPPASSRSQHQ
jgi:hypothetical protein